jgi:hypothetical protein
MKNEGSNFTAYKLHGRGSVLVQNIYELILFTSNKEIIKLPSSIVKEIANFQGTFEPSVDKRYTLKLHKIMVPPWFCKIHYQSKIHKVYL